MNKSTAIELLGGSVGRAAKILGVTPSAISQWPDPLSQGVADRVRGAALRAAQMVDAAPPKANAKPATRQLAAAVTRQGGRRG